MNAISELRQEQSSELNVVSTDSAALILDTHSMDNMYRLAEIMAKGRSTIPEHLRNNTGDCMAIVMQSVQWRMNPYSVAQKTHTVNGILGYEGQLVNAVITSSGVTKDRLNYEWFGDWKKIIGKTKVIQMPAKDNKKAYEFRVPDYKMEDEVGLGIKVWATLKGEENPRELELLLVQASVRNSPLWATDPKQQLAYLAAKRWARLHAPDVILGVYTRDELDNSDKERYMGDADVVRNEEKSDKKEGLLTCPDEAFAEQKAKWKSVVESGKQTADELLKKISTRATFTEAQKKEVLSWKKIEVQTVQTKDEFDSALDASGDYNGGHVPE